MTTIRGFEMAGAGRAARAPSRREVGGARARRRPRPGRRLRRLPHGPRLPPRRRADPARAAPDPRPRDQRLRRGRRAAMPRRSSGTAVVVPAVLPCGECALCRAGRPTICRIPDHAGQRSRRRLRDARDPAGRGSSAACRARAKIPTRRSASAPGLTLRHLAVVADAVSTAYQAVERSGVARGGARRSSSGSEAWEAIAAQIAAERGAAVVGLDVDPRRLEAASSVGVGPRARSPRALCGQGAARPDRGVRAARPARRRRAGRSSSARARPPASRRPSACSCHGATLMVVGFTLETRRDPALESHGLRRPGPRQLGMRARALPRDPREGARREDRRRLADELRPLVEDRGGARGRSQTHRAGRRQRARRRPEAEEVA